MTQEAIDNLPEHLKGIVFEPWHFYRNAKAKKGENRLLLNDCFIDEVMRMKNLYFTPEMTEHLPYGDNALYIEAKVSVYNLEDNGKSRGPITTAFSSVTKMPHEGGQTHFAQIAITRALKTAVLRHLHISDHDVELAINAYEIKENLVSTKTRNISDDEPDDESDAKPIAIEPEIDLNLGI